MPSAIVFLRPTVPEARGRGRARLYLRRRSPTRRLRRPKALGFYQTQRVAGSLGLATWSLGVRGRSDICFCAKQQQPLGCVVFVALARCSANEPDCFFVNDPSAGSPTETLLRLLRPLESTVCPSSRHQRRKRVAAPSGPVQGAH